MTDKYYTLQEVAEIIKVSYLTVYRWVQAGKITTHRVGKQYRIAHSDLQQIIKTYEGKQQV